MSDCQTCCATDVLVNADFDYGTLVYATQGFSFVEDCPPGYYCQPGLFPITVTIPKDDIPPVRRPPPGTPFVLTLRGCQSTITASIGADFTDAQVEAAILGMQRAWAAQQAVCNVIDTYGLRPKPRLITLPTACLNNTYSVGSRPLPGPGPYTFIISGSPPPGITVSQFSETSIEIVGTPTATGTYTFTAKIGTLQINYQVSVMGITNSPTQANKGTAYSFQYTVAGGIAPYTFALVSGTLPDGLSLSSSGLISGTPTGSGTSNFDISITDSSSP